MSTLILPYPSTHPDLCHGKYVAGLFAKGEQGAWYDPSDLSTLFQDDYGTTPVTAVGQPVGLILDKSKGLVRGPELVTNGTFDTNINGWTSNQGQTPVWSAGRLRLSTQGNTGTSVLQAISCVVGRSYALTVSFMTVSGDGVGPGLRISTSGVDYGASGQIYRSPYESPTAFVNRTAVFTATQATIYVYLIASGGTMTTTTYEFDNISVRELPGNHATQATTTSRPTLKQDASGKYYLSFDGVDDYLSTGSINFTATDKMTVFTADHSVYDNPTGPRAIVGLSTSVFGYNGTWWLTAYDWGNNATSLAYLRGNQRGVASYGPDQRSLGYRTLVRAVRFDISKDLVSDEVQVSTNGVRQEIKVVMGPSAGSGAFGNYPLYIGAVGTNYPFKGNLYGLIVRGAATDDLHLTHAEKYLAYKSGVTL